MMIFTIARGQPASKQKSWRRLVNNRAPLLGQASPCGVVLLQVLALSCSVPIGLHWLHEQSTSLDCAVNHRTLIAQSINPGRVRSRKRWGMRGKLKFFDEVGDARQAKVFCCIKIRSRVASFQHKERLNESEYSSFHRTPSQT